VPFPSPFRHRLVDDNHEQQYSNIDQAINTGNHANIIQSPGQIADFDNQKVPDNVQAHSQFGGNQHIFSSGRAQRGQNTVHHKSAQRTPHY